MRTGLSIEHHSPIVAFRGLSRSLLTACAALALCIGIPKLTWLIPLAKKLPILNKPAQAIEKYHFLNDLESFESCSYRTLQKTESSTILANLIRERHVYKSSYETLTEVAEIEHNGNILHKIAFSFLGQYLHFENQPIFL